MEQNSVVKGEHWAQGQGEEPPESHAQPFALAADMGIGPGHGHGEARGVRQHEIAGLVACAPPHQEVVVHLVGFALRPRIRSVREDERSHGAPVSRGQAFH
jgi:hypothetical protein